LDGYIATHTGDSRYVTGTWARQRVQELRRELPAIAVGIQTVLADDPQLTVRLDGSFDRQPLRVVFDSSLRMPTTARLLFEPGRTVIYCTDAVHDSKIAEIQSVRPNHVQVVSLPSDGHHRVALEKALIDLGTRGINAVLLEGGATLTAEFLRKKLIDRIVYFVAPKLLGGGISVLSQFESSVMSEVVSLKDIRWEQIGPDLCVQGSLLYP
jgi:diaminohydroxyphosphoribosylaminopyrimidine deaminase/5-amino-6-(5-phosphoribosylamino)uracil reductase